MKRILAIVCICILLLFTGMPMFTSNLLCNDSNVYADSVPDQLYTDREKIIAAMTVYFNDHKGILKILNSGQDVDAAKYAATAYDMYISPFITYYRYEQSTIQTLADIAGYIDVTNDPFIVRMYSPAVGFFNAFLQWMMDNKGITNSPTGSDGLYNGMMYGGHLFYVVNDNLQLINDVYLIAQNNVSDGTPVGADSETAYNRFYQAGGNNSNIDLSSVNNNTSGLVNTSVSVTYNADDIYNIAISLYQSRGDTSIDYNPCLCRSAPGSREREKCRIWYAERDHKIRGNPAYFLNTYNNITKMYIGFVSKDFSNNKYYFESFKEVTRNDNFDPTNANINFNKDDFDSTPTTPPTGSDGLEYEPKQTGTGNTYNNYNNYYNDYYEGDTYIYKPGSGGGGSGGDDPGGGGEDPTPGGTTPPWDGSNPGTPSGTLTPVEGGGYNFNLPDLGIPDLNIDWSINGLKDKFPFSIPWDLMAFFAVLNAEPETPEIQATIPLGLWEWEIDWDLHQFDSIALILRNLEFIGFCIGLIVVTRSIIKG